MVNFQVKKMLGKVIGDYKITEHLGSGGNADVFKVIDGKQEYFAMKLLIVSNNKYFTKKYARFKDEIHVVKENQGEIQGIIPIIDIYLPDNPSPNDRPWYTMPIAEPLSKYLIKLEAVETVITCVNELSKVLVCLHEKDIVHRDIKPSNIYYYNNAWVFGDFGLVNYPEKTDLTVKGESVGPKNTIAPEMKRDAINADGKPADVYSLAKTLWILITKEKDGFDGQYSHKIGAFNLDNRINTDKYRRCFTVTLHKLIESSTSNVPNERPSAEDFNKTLNDWFELNQNYKKSNILEWEFYIRDIIPSTLPEKISWTNLEDILEILKMISHTNLNHTFFPSGGGMDLNGCSLSNQEGYLELDVGYILKLKPSRLTLNTFKASFDWNYFYLETEEIKPPIQVDDTLERERFDMELIELSPGEYALFEYEKDILGRRLMLHLNGGLVLFAKGSVYNSISSTYDGRHNRGTPDDFRRYIQRLINQINFDRDNPEIAKERKEKRRILREEQEAAEREVYIEQSQKFNDMWEIKLRELSFPTGATSDTSNNKIGYSLSFHSDIIEKYYYISKELRMIHYATGWYEETENEDEYLEKTFLFYDYDVLIEYVQYLEKEFEVLDRNTFDIPLMLNFNVSVHRLRKPSILFSREELQSLILQAVSDEFVCIDFDGNVHLKQHSEFSRLLRSQFPVISTQSEIENIHKVPKEFELLYLSLLSAWLYHLVANKSEVITDTDLEIFELNENVEDNLLADIRVAQDRYPE